MKISILADLPRVAHGLHREPWMILPERHGMLVEELARTTTEQAMRGRLAEAGMRLNLQDEAEEAAAGTEGYVNPITTYDRRSGLAMIAVEGIVGKKLGLLDRLWGGVDLQLLEDGLERLEALRPTAVQLYLDTPGGAVTGVAEAAAMIEEFSARVAPVHAYSDIACCCAGEWLASAAATRMAAGSALVGGIGILAAIFDQSSRYSMQGVGVMLSRSGPLKGAGFPGVKPSEAQLEAMQVEVTRMGAEFFQQMNRRQRATGRPALTPAVHFAGGTFRAGSPEGRKLVNYVMPSRAGHLQWLAGHYARRQIAG